MGLPLASEEDRSEKHPSAFRTITEVSEELGVPQHVLRFWESRFVQIRPLKRAGGRRYYRPEDVDLLRGVRRLLHGQGYTIRGAQRILKEHGPRFVQAIGRGETEAGPPLAQERDEQERDAQARDGEGSVPADATASGRASLEAVLAELHSCRALLAALDTPDPEPHEAA
ncbi:MerR family transcriptional regulator [Methylobacterium sp. Leaf118]|uniref:MerR family transcriptional regulator n=1 Tax=Methylobacterium sp. Leaf118 TaxID=2876562 RepID=UPI001E5546FB|nr:MerR family transcriptional regulator [Methylobacterium sp. Leaf118]